MQTTDIQFKRGVTDGHIVDVMCIECNRPTKHDVEASLGKYGSHSDDQEGWSVEWTDHYQVVKCRGCEKVTFRQTSWFSEDFPEDGETVRLYPKRDNNSVVAKGFPNVPTAIRRLYVEVTDCFNNESMMLCAGGLRSLVEGVCADQKIIDGPVPAAAKGGGTQLVRSETLAGKISGLHEKGLLSKTSADTLHELRFLGNYALHELAQPSADELKNALNILEHVLEQLYEIPEKALELQRTRAKRTPAPTVVAMVAAPASATASPMQVVITPPTVAASPVPPSSL